MFTNLIKQNLDEQLNIVQDISSAIPADQKPNQTVLFEIQGIEDYKLSVKPIFSEQKKKVIKQKLDLQQHALRRTRQRQAAGDYFVNYSENPFTKLGNKEISMRRNINRNIQATKQQKNLVYELINLQHKEVNEQILNKKDQFNAIKKHNQELSNKILTKIETMNSNTYLKLNQNLSNFKVNETAIKIGQIQVNEADMILDDILNIKQENFFLTTSEQINVFKYAINQDKFFLGSGQILQNYHFSFNSIIEKVQKVKMATYRDISRMSRRLILGLPVVEKIDDIIDSYELSFKVHQLTFSDLMNIVSGRFTPKKVFDIMNIESAMNAKDTSVTTSSQISGKQSEVIYKDQTLNKNLRWSNSNEEVQEVSQYLRLSLNEKEFQYLKKCEQTKKQSIKMLQAKDTLQNNHIKDQSIHQNLDNRIDQQLTQFANLNQFYKDVDRYIRTNKMNKTKNESIKLKYIIQMMEIRQKFQEKKYCDLSKIKNKK